MKMMGLTLRSVEGIDHICKQRDESTPCDSKQHQCTTCYRNRVAACMMLNMSAAEQIASKGMQPERD